MLDHIVLATPDVQASVEAIAAATGIRAELGGHFQGRGVYNHLIALEDDAYLEIIGPRPEPRPTTRVRCRSACTSFSSAAPTCRTFATRRATRSKSERRRRKRPASTSARCVRWVASWPMARGSDWHLTVGGWPPLLGGLVPFLINWGDARHPSTTAVKGARLASWHGEHPDLDAVRRAHDAMGVRVGTSRRP